MAAKVDFHRVEIEAVQTYLAILIALTLMPWSGAILVTLSSD
jgi:hypothetical protein